MGEERKDTETELAVTEKDGAEKQRVKKQVAVGEDLASLSGLPQELLRSLLQKFYPVTLLALRANRFFYGVVNNFILFVENSKLTLIQLFRPKNEKSKPAKETFRQLIFKSEVVTKKEKLSMAGTNLAGVDFDALPLEHLDLKGADCRGVSFWPVQKTDLWNRIDLDALNQIDPYAHALSAKYDVFEEYFGVDTQNNDLVEHCILYNLAHFPIQNELKRSLVFSFRDRSIVEDGMPRLLLDFLLSHIQNCRQFNTPQPFSEKTPKWARKFSLWVDCPKEHAAEFKKWSEEIAKCFPAEKNGTVSASGDFDDYSFFARETVQLEEKDKDIEQFMFVLNDDYAYRLYHTHPLVIARTLSSQVKYLLADDVFETCQLLLQETEKFRGFSRGIPDEKIDEIQNNLRISIRKARKFTAIKKWVEENGGYKDVQLLALKKRINNEKFPDTYKTDLFEAFINKKLSYTIQAIEDVFKTQPYDKNRCLAVFKEQLNQSCLSVADRSVLFDRFKNREELNRHRNPNFDSIVGIKNTTSWRNTWKEIRDDAKTKLFAEVDTLPDNQAKNEQLDDFKRQPLFADHRNNFFFEGAFGRTQAVIDIEEKQDAVSLVFH